MVFDGHEPDPVGMTFTAGQDKAGGGIRKVIETFKWEDWRGPWDPAARIADMDLAGIWASLNFPSLIAGFSGTVFWKSDDPELGLAVLRAWNDWHREAWAGAYPDRIIPLQLPWLADPQLAAEELSRNAARGFKAVSFPELPAQCGLPSLHTGSAQWAPIPAPDTPFETITTLFPVNALVACADWLW